MDGIEVHGESRAGSGARQADSSAVDGAREATDRARGAKTGCGETGGRAAPWCPRERLEPMAHGAAEPCIGCQEGGQPRAVVAGAGS